VPIGIAAAVAGAILAIVLIGTGDHERRASTSTPRATQNAPAQAKKTTKAPTAATNQPAQSEPRSPSSAGAASASSSDTPSNQDPAALNDRGFALSEGGDYSAALPLLRASVDGYRSAGRTKELGYAYALFNLAVALNHSGDHAGAIELLRERLSFRNQLPAVQRELKDASSQLRGPKNRTNEEGTGAGG
jgi:tetratricopeptide (TPR) repeat protein